MKFLLYRRLQKAALKDLRKQRRSRPQMVRTTAAGSRGGIAARGDRASPLVQSPATKTWGQRCSETCGCLLRFETTIDPQTQRITDVSYDAKTLLTTTITSAQLPAENRTKLQPQLTNRTGRPMMAPCKCETVHELCAQAVDFLPGQTMHSARNMMEFASFRSSDALRHAILIKHERPTSDLHCFDLVEESLAAAIHGYMPSRRRRRAEAYGSMLSRRLLMQEKCTQDEDGVVVAVQGQPDSGQPRTNDTTASLSSPSSFFDNDDSASAETHSIRTWTDYVAEQRYGEASRAPGPKIYDWVSYVDSYGQQRPHEEQEKAA
eukprot:CAMPEP_0198123268 /NCGR_PEP_ID=MMETSP1442-20131203/37132_1 /TAXON_ID= /ORGANISM="Craspedostauros australis, Strain CCMP3328" /LENGTH=319 /DNA_ID=CAMNT_0043782445 /DNA_START=128 /DNA_END=1087 /DNA_ORIENTATION=-